jgi:hypothetical protein
VTFGSLLHPYKECIFYFRIYYESKCTKTEVAGVLEYFSLVLLSTWIYRGRCESIYIMDANAEPPTLLAVEAGCVQEDEVTAVDWGWEGGDAIREVQFTRLNLSQSSAYNTMCPFDL